MENASKALLIAGGVLLAMLVVSLLVFSWGRFSEFYSNQDELQEIEDVTKFNLQFTAYQNRVVHGYELISLANKVADYNMRYSSAEGARNDERYTPIKMVFTMTIPQAESFRFSKEIPDVNGNGKIASQRDRLFRFTTYTQSEVSNQIVGQIFDTATKIEDLVGGSSPANKLAKSINSLILSEEQYNYNKQHKNMNETQSRQVALEDYNSMTNKNKIENYKKDATKIDSDYKEMIRFLTNEADIMKYYEYVQFKKGIFKCEENDIQYDTVSNRVKTIKFTFTGTIE